MLPALAILLAAPATAYEPGVGPLFSSHDPLHAELARRAWRAAVACTGWEAAAHDIVKIEHGYLSGGLAGGAWLDDEGLYRIVLGPDLPERALVHEIAHAWARSGPSALTEGRADLLADCIVTEAPGIAPFDPDPGSPLDAMPDLRRWNNPHDDHGVVGGDADASRRDAYLGAARFLRVVATVVDPKALWPESGTLRWRDLERLLDDSDAPGAIVLAVLEGGAERQRAALSDNDRDGVPWLAEAIVGTNPDRWDSDGDGWWDGAPKPPSVAAVPLPLDGTPVCTGFASGPEGGHVQVVTAGELRGRTLPWVSVHAGAKPVAGDPSDGLDVPPNETMLIALHGPIARSTGGMWAMVGGQGLIVDWSCRSSPTWTVWVEDPLAAPLLDAFALALEEHARRADALLNGPPPRRIVVVLGTPEAGFRDGAVQLSTGQVRWALQSQRPDALAALAVSVHRVWHGDDTTRSWDAAEGLTRALVDDPPDLTFVGVDLRDAEAWGEHASACPEGWDGVLQGRCR